MRNGRHSRRKLCLPEESYRSTILSLFFIVCLLFLALSAIKNNINVTEYYNWNIIMKHQIKNGQFWLKPAQVKKLIYHAASIRDKLILELLYYCGLRRSEVVRIQPGDINFKDKVLTVKGKGQKIRYVPIPDETLQGIKLFLGHTERPYLFNAVKKRRSPIVPHVVNRVVRAAGKAAGIENPNTRMIGINPHLLRHSAARRLKDKGVSLECISNFLGHEKLSITADIYGLMSYDDVVFQVRKAIG